MINNIPVLNLKYRILLVFYVKVSRYVLNTLILPCSQYKMLLL